MPSSSSAPPNYHTIISDCIPIIFNYYVCEVVAGLQKEGMNSRISSSELADGADDATRWENSPYNSTSDALFALKYFVFWYFGVEASALPTVLAQYWDPEILKIDHHQHQQQSKETAVTGEEGDAAPLHQQLMHLPKSSGMHRVHVKCGAPITDPAAVFPYFQHVYSLSIILVPESPQTPEAFTHLKNLVEFSVRRCDDLTDEALQHLESLQFLDLSCQESSSLTDEAFKNMKHLRKLDISCFYQLTDKAIENLYLAGSRLEYLDIGACRQMTDRALSFLGGIQELNIDRCPFISDSGLQHVGESLRVIHIDGRNERTSKSFQYFKRLENLYMRDMRGIDFHEAFRYLGRSLQYMMTYWSDMDSLNDSSFEYLTGIRSLCFLCSSMTNLTDNAFQHLAGIKILVLDHCEVPNLTKNFIFHLSKIKMLNIVGTGIKIEANDVPTLKTVFADIYTLEVSEDFADSDTMGELRQYIEHIGGKVNVHKIS